MLPVHSEKELVMANLEQGDYFTAYQDLSVHELMLKDRPRVQAYRKFFENNQHLIKGKVVMDVGAGTGILSLLAAMAGAKKVFAVEASSVATLCEEIVQENSLSHIVQVIHGTVETIALPAGISQVDVIISEWMGFYLLHESMLDSVLVARDRFLAPGGLMVPSHARLLLAPVDMTAHFQDRSDQWSNIYGFDFSPVASLMNMEEVSKPLITSISPSTLQAEPELLAHLDLMTVTTEDVQCLSAKLTFPVKEDSKIFGFAAWFEVEFNTNVKVNDKNISIEENLTVNCNAGHVELSDMGEDRSVNSLIDTDNGSTNKKLKNEDVIDNAGNLASAETLSLIAVDTSSLTSVDTSSLTSVDTSSVVLRTGPCDPTTHWKQTVFFLPRAIVVSGNSGLSCRVNMSQDQRNKRHYNISITLLDGEGEEETECNGYMSEESGSEDSVSEDHPVPCDCGSDRCRLISALLDKYEEEQDQDVLDLTAEEPVSTPADTDGQKPS